MADRYLLESSSVDGYLLEDSSGVLLFEVGSTDLTGQIGTTRSGVIVTVVIYAVTAWDLQLFPVVDGRVILGAPLPPLPDPAVVVVLYPVQTPNETIILGPPGQSSAVSVTLTSLTATSAQGTFVFGDATKALTGLAATTTPGTLTSIVSGVLIGQTATSSSGSITPQVSVVLTGQSNTVTGGSLAVSEVITLIGLVSTASGGLLTATFSQDLTGLSAVTAQGVLSVAIAVTLTGQGATATKGDVTAFAGFGAVLTGFTLTATQGDLGVVLSTPLEGQGAVATEGDITPFVGYGASLNGFTLTTTQGDLSVGISVTLDSQIATTAQGTFGISLTIDVDQLLTGLRIRAYHGYILFAQATDKRTNMFFLSILDESIFVESPELLFVVTEDEDDSVTTSIEEYATPLTEPELIA